MLIAKPAFSAVAILSIALGIGATTAIFSVVYAVLIDPYPYRDANHIGQVFLTSKKNPSWRPNFTRGQFEEIKARARSMQDAVAMNRSEVVMSGTGFAQAVVRLQCSSNFFDFFGVPPVKGRAFTASNQAADAVPEQIAVISYKFWQSAFQGRPDVVGQKIRLNDDVYTVAGVLPTRFTWMDVDAYVPLPPLQAANRDQYYTVIFRIRPGVSESALNSDLLPVLHEFQRQVPRYMYPEDDFKAKFLNVNEGILGKFATTLLVLLGAVTLLLLIGCGNVSNLLLARAAAREGEMAIRVSVGASRLRLVSQLLTESILLALAGGVLGIGLAYAAVQAVVALMPEYSIPHEAVVSLNLPVLCFAVGVSVITGIVFGLAPALQYSADSQADTLRGAGRGSSVGSRRRRLHDLLIVAEITLSIVLLTGSGMAVRGLFALQNQPLGYNPQHALTFEVPLREGHYTKWADRLDFCERVSSYLRRMPQVQAASVSSTFVPPYNGFRTRAFLDGGPRSEPPETEINLVQDGYFAAVGTKLMRGRDLNESDILLARPVAIVTDDLAKRYFPAENAIGHHIIVDIFNQALPHELLKSPNFRNSFEVIGVANSAVNRGLQEPALPAIFIPYSNLLPSTFFFIVRTTEDADSLAGLCRQAVRATDETQPVTEIRTLEGWLNRATAYESFSTFLFGTFGVVGLLLAAVGVFSVVSYSVEHRTHEFGIRMALGALPGDVLKEVLLSTGRLLGIGLLVGIAFSVMAGRALASKMQGMGSADLWLFLLVPAVMIVTALAASFMPARSATRVEPMVALRYN
jgi:putative ABC transport system permease protein